MGKEVWNDLWADSHLPEWDDLSEAVFQALVRESGGLTGKRVLEAGAGSGRISARLTQEGASVYLVDYSEKAIELAKREFRAKGIEGHFHQGDIRHLPYDDDFFDISWSSGVIEHYNYREQMAILSELARVTKPEGLIINIVPFARSPFYILGKWWGEKSGRWPYGIEIPMTTFAPHARELGAEIINEYTIDPITSLEFLKYVPGSRDFLQSIELSLGADSELRASLPGYLLVSTLKVHKSGRSIKPIKQPGEAQMGRSPCETESRLPERPMQAAPYLFAEGYSTIVCLSSINWDFLIQRPQQIMRKLRDIGFKILYINPSGKTFLTETNLTNLSKKDISMLIFDQLPKMVSQVEPGIFVASPAFNIKDKSGNVLGVLGEFMNALKRFFSLDKYIFWVLLPGWFPVVANEPHALVIYDCVDEHSGFDPSPHNALNETRLMEKADVILVTSRTLIKSKRAFSDHFYYLPNGVNLRFFQGEFPEPKDLERIPHPRIGFVGALSRWVDVDLIRELALGKPEWSFVLIGPHYVDKTPLSLPNVYFLGTKPYDELPGYYRHLDVGLIPFKTDDILAFNSNPIKAYEYLAAGLPVVSTDIPEIRPLSHIVKIADRQGFQSAIQDALITSGAPGEHKPQMERETAISKYEWYKLVDTACAVIASKVAASSGEYRLASDILASVLPDSVDKPRLHQDIRLYRRLADYAEAPIGLVDHHVSEKRSASKAQQNRVSPLRISCRLPYCMLMFPDWSTPDGPWAPTLKCLVRSFMHNDRLTLALRADPLEIPLEKALEIVSNLISEVTSEETSLIKNMVLVNDLLGPEELDLLLLTVDAVLVPEVVSERDHLKDRCQELAITAENSESRMSQIIKRSQALGITVLRASVCGDRLNLAIISKMNKQRQSGWV